MHHWAPLAETGGSAGADVGGEVLGATVTVGAGVRKSGADEDVAVAGAVGGCGDAEVGEAGGGCEGEGVCEGDGVRGEFGLTHLMETAPLLP